MTEERTAQGVTRRTLLGTAVGSPLVLSACSDGTEKSAPGKEVPAEARRQAGIDRPIPRQGFLALAVCQLNSSSDPEETLAAIGDLIAGGPEDQRLTVTVGVGPAIVAAARGEGTFGSTELPAFVKDKLEPGLDRGDILLQVCADTADVANLNLRQILGGLTDSVRAAWQSTGFVGETDGRGARNVLGFYDGIAVPVTPEDLNADVWTGKEEGLEDATIAVVRRIRLDVPGFLDLPVKTQEGAIGRTKKDGFPLSGGDFNADVNLTAKSETGVLDIPLDAHVRRAHPLTNGAGSLMLRRGYSYKFSTRDQGLIFISFQRRLDMFVKTQQAMDESDAMMEFATTTASATFLILPAATDSKPLGAALWA